MAWAMYYVVASFRQVVPWSLCGQWWNTLRCTDLSRALNDTAANSSSSFLNVTMAWTNHTSEAWSGKSSDTQKTRYCQQIISCSTPPPAPLPPPNYAIVSSFLHISHNYAIIRIILDINHNYVIVCSFLDTSHNYAIASSFLDISHNYAIISSFLESALCLHKQPYAFISSLLDSNFMPS